MRNLVIVFTAALIALLAGCNLADSSHDNSDEYDEIRENVWTFVQTTEMPQSEEWKNAWLNGKVEEIQLEGNMADYSNLSADYHGETVLLVTPSFEKELVAYPRIVVSPDTREVIDVFPGE